MIKEFVLKISIKSKVPLEGRQRLHYELRVASANLQIPKVRCSLMDYFQLSQSFYSESTSDVVQKERKTKTQPKR